MNDFSLTRVIVNRWIPLKSAMKMFTQAIRFKIHGNQFHHRNSMSIIAHRFVDLVRNIRGTRANGGDRPRNLINAGKGPLKKLVPWKWEKGTLKIPSGKMSEKKSCSKFYSVKTMCAVKCQFAETTNVIPESSVIHRESLIRKRSDEIRNTKNIRKEEKASRRRVCRLWNKKRKAKGTTNGESQFYRGSCSSCLCSCVPHPCDLNPSWPCFVHPKHFHRRQRKRESARVVDKRERAGTECVCKSFKRPVKIASEVGFRR